MVLASTTKVVTALAAIDTLGLKYRWRTRAYLQGTLSDGVLDGDLMLVGGGNPTLTSDELVAWFRQMHKRGLREIRGNIVLDRFAFRLTDNDHVNTPQEDPDKPHHRWPEALIVNRGLLEVDISVEAGAARVVFTPPLDGVDVVDKLQVRTVKCSAPRNPPRIEIDPESESLKLVVAGEWSPTCGTRRVELSTGASSGFSKSAVAAAWRIAGGALAGEAVERPPLARLARWVTPARPWAIHESRPLAQVLREMNKWSDNVIARHVMLSMARGFPNRAATLPDARARLADWLRKQGLLPGDISVDNGSGLAHNERGRARAMVQLLRQSWNSKSGKVFLETLPVAGQDGTISGRLRDDGVRGRAFLKTGTLAQSRALAGYVKARSGRVYAVAAVVNHAQATKGVPALDAFIEWVAENG